MDGTVTTRTERLSSIDLLRGIVMVVMALDHCRDYFGNAIVNPMNVETTTPLLFFTRWVTHFCAPVFVFLAGTSIYLMRARRQPRELAVFLVTRGLWLIFLELTVVSTAWFLENTWFFGRVPSFLIFQVIGAIGASMVLMAGLVFLSTRVVAGIGLAIVFGHNLLDRFDGSGFGLLWRFVHSPDLSSFDPNGLTFWIAYPILPWAGVMAVGYACGAWIRRPAAERSKLLLWTGLAVTALFVVVRGINAYGDPVPWASRDQGLRTVFSFLNCQKYPPSLAYLAMTLGPSLVFLSFAERLRGPLAKAFTTFGRVPLLFYLAHLYLIHVGAKAMYALAGSALSFPPIVPPADYGRGLGVVYVAWVGVVLLLYPLCRFYADFKARKRSVWLSYL